MDVGLLDKLMGGDRVWSSPCTVIVDTNAVVKASGQDAIATGGQKTYAPRYSSGRIEADSVCIVKEFNTIIVLQQRRHKDGTGAEQILQTVTYVDPVHVVGIEFANGQSLSNFGMIAPTLRTDIGYRPDMVVG